MGKNARRLRRPRRSLRSGLVWLVLLSGCGDGRTDVRVGSTAFTESVILGELAAQRARAAGADVSHAEAVGGNGVAWDALVAGEIDLYSVYTGTLSSTVLRGVPADSLPELRAAAAAYGVRLSEPLGFSNSYALGVRRDRAEELGLETISDLRDRPDLTLRFSTEFLDRADGWRALKRDYRLPQTDALGLEHELAYRGLATGRVDVTDLYTTDAKLLGSDIVQLTDDRGFFPDYRCVIAYRADLPGRAPAALAAVLDLAGRIDEPAMIRMNARVDRDGLTERESAGEFLTATYGAAPQPPGPGRARRIFDRTLEHLVLVGTALGLGLLAAIPLGVFAAKCPRPGGWVLAGAGLLQTVPSLALFVFLIPLLGLGFAPAVTALFLYSLLPVVRGTHAGIAGIPASLTESAVALGLPPRTRLWRIELPLAAAAIFSGVKTAAVICVGTATLGGFIAAGGYGDPIFAGLRRADTAQVLEGAIPAAVMALLVQAGFDWLERSLASGGRKPPVSS